MKKIIALYRRGGTGKTATLNLVIDLLQVAATGCPMPTPQPTGHNRRETIIYNGQKVSICTAGDDEAQLLANEAYFNAQKCDIAITASRTKGKTVAIIHNMQTVHSATLDWVRKQVGIPHAPLNLSDAQKIIALI